MIRLVSALLAIAAVNLAAQEDRTAPPATTPAVPTVADPDTREAALEVVRRMREAAGQTADRKIDSVRLQVELSIPTQGIRGRSVATYKAPNKIRVEIAIPNFPRTIELFDGEKGYTVMVGLGVIPKTGPELDLLRFQALTSDPMLDAAKFYEKIELDKTRHEINDRACLRLVATPPTACRVAPIEIFVDPTDYRTVRTKQMVPASGGQFLSVVDFSAYKEFDGLMLPTLQTTVIMGNRIEAKLLMAEFNIAPEDRIFAPDEND